MSDGNNADLGRHIASGGTVASYAYNLFAGHKAWLKQHQAEQKDKDD